MILLDFVGERGLRIPRERYSEPAAVARACGPRPGGRGWARSSRGARGAGGARTITFPFIRQGVPAVDLIDFDFPCFHRRCDDMSRISARSLDAVGETVLELLPTL